MNAMQSSLFDAGPIDPYESGLQRKIVRLQVALRSIYRMEDEARWGWQHSVEPVVEARWSITLRTMAKCTSAIR